MRKCVKNLIINKIPLLQRRGFPTPVKIDLVFVVSKTDTTKTKDVRLHVPEQDGDREINAEC